MATKNDVFFYSQQKKTSFLVGISDKFQTFLFFQNFSWQYLGRYDLSIASTETKYIKLKTKTQNNIVIFAFFETIWLKYECLQRITSFVFLVF